MKRNYLVISIIALSVLLFFEITSVASLITEVKGQTHSSEHSSQSFKQSEQSTIKSQSTETANVKEAIQESAEKVQSQSSQSTQDSTKRAEIRLSKASQSALMMDQERPQHRSFCES